MHNIEYKVIEGRWCANGVSYKELTQEGKKAITAHINHVKTLIDNLKY